MVVLGGVGLGSLALTTGTNTPLWQCRRLLRRCNGGGELLYVARAHLIAPQYKWPQDKPFAKAVGQNVSTLLEEKWDTKLLALENEMKSFITNELALVK